MTKVKLLFLILIGASLATVGTSLSAHQPIPAAASDKTIVLPDPNRPSFDQWSNEFDYQGNLMSIGSCNPDPISHQPNPYCPTTPAQPAAASPKVNESCNK